MTISTSTTRGSLSSKHLQKVSCVRGFDSLGLTYGHRSELSEDAILVANNGIRVPFGRSVFIDPINDLVLQVRPGDKCTITVLDNDPLSQKPGQLSPKKFPCEFGPSDVKYSHFGSRSPAKDRVRLQLRYDTQTDTVIIPFMMEVEVIFTQLEILIKNMPLTVDKLLGTSNPIDKKILEFTYDRNMYQCKVTSLAGTGVLPRLNIRYRHTFTQRSPNRDYIPMYVELQDKESNVMKQEFFQIMVRIKEGEENTPPKPSFIAMMMMEVDQFVMTAITPDMLAAEDVESPPDDLIFNITSPLSFEEGYIVSTDDRNLPITSFYQGDLKDLKIAYKPPSEDSDAERIFQIEFVVVDTEGAVSDPFAFMIVVKPMNTLAPVVIRNTGQLLYEGQTRSLSSSQNLQISDEDNLHDVRVTVIDGLRHGELTVIGSRSKFFTVADLDHGSVIYQHDGSDTYSDNIIFRMTDGRHEVEFLFPITVVPTDDEPPIINANTGLVMLKNQMMPISPLMLSAADIDSEDSTIKFILEEPFSSIGEVLLRQLDAPEDPSTWRFNSEDEMYEKVVTDWLQQDITDGKLFYRHVGPHNTKTTMDQFVFRVQDDNDPPNRSGQNSFIIKILPIDDIPPELYPDTTLKLTPPRDTDENNPVILGAIVLTESPNSEFHYTVEDTAGNSVDGAFTIFLQPVDNKPPQITNTGFTVLERGMHLQYIFTDLTKGDSFNLDDISQGKISYSHNGDESTNDFFQLDVSDGVHIVTITIKINVKLIDDETPTISLPEEDAPVFGEILVNGVPGNRFTQADIISGLVVYAHTMGGNKIKGVRVHVTILPIDSQAPQVFVGHQFSVVEGSEKSSIHKGVEPVEDRFTFRCSDGINFSEKHFFPIVIIPSNDEKPEIHMREFVVMEGTNVVIDTPILNGVDADIPSDELTFIITKPPKHGFIINQLITGTLPVTNFTLDQIREASSIVYEHDDSETTEDSFKVLLTDGKFTVEKTVIIMVIPVDDETPRLAINDGLEIEIGEIKEITNKILKATDLDTKDSTLTYIIRYGPNQGILQKRTPFGTLQNITIGMNFTQNDIDENLIIYVHNGQEGIRDLIKFDVTDSINPLIDRYFYVTVGGIDMVFPDVISKGVSLKEGGRVTLTTDLLSTSDLNSPDEHLVFTITRAPVRGHLECTDTPGMPITSFTQLQLAGNKIYYIHTADDEIKMDSFEFEVTDGYNPVFRTFRISISDVDNKKPVVTIHGLVVNEGKNKLITPFELTVEDRDTVDQLLKFTITQPPIHGKLLFNNTRTIMSFTKQDLNENRISYKHDGTESTSDSFSFTVTDGTHSDFYVFPDTVFETRKPQIVVNKGGTALKTLPSGHLGFVITSKALKAEDRDSTHGAVTFRVTVGAEHGYLIDLGKGNATVTTFTQADIDDMHICYVLRNGDNATSDIFHFSIEDNVQ
ncbi:hypothetical protein QTP86_008468 [Hemibagrus guttatus]|nr:hypothetical protein QTP86_008468 [Hemibagrus guttatus]